MLVTERIYYTLNELQDPLAQSPSFATLFAYWDLSFTDDTKTTKLYEDIENQYGQDYCLYIDIKHSQWEEIPTPTPEDIQDDQDLKKQVVKCLKKMIAWLNDSKDKYEPLIDLYDSKKNSLLEQVKTTSKTKFNDTPQTTNVGLDGDEYATTYTINENSNDMGTVMTRLNEVRAFWDSIYVDWVDEYSRKFVLY